MSTVQDTQQKQATKSKIKTKSKSKSKSKTDTDIDTNDEKKERASIVELVKRKLKKKKKQKKQQQEEEKVETATASVNVPTGSGSSEATTPVPITNASQADQAITTTSNIVSDDVSTEPTHLSTPGAITTTITPIPVTTKNAPPDNQATIDEDEDIVFPDFKSHAKDSEKFEKALEMLTHFFGITKDVSEATPILAPLKAACGVTLRAIEITKGAHNISVGWAELCEDLRPHVQMLQNHRRDIEKGRQAIDGRYVAALHHYLSIVKLIIDQAHLHAPKNEKVGFLQKFVRTAAVQTGKEEIDRYRQRLTSAWRLYNDALGGDMLRKVDDVNNNVRRMIRNQARTRRLGPYQDDYTAGGSIPKHALGDGLDPCEHGTRMHELEVIRKWAADLESPEQIFWLNDSAGTGKTTIAVTLGMGWQLSGQLVGRFFLSSETSPEKVLRDLCFTLAKDMAANQRDLRDIVTDILSDESLDHLLQFGALFRQLVFEPLQRLPGTRPVYIIIDGLDHSTTKLQRRELLDTLIRLLPSVKHVKVFLTSLPLQDISDILIDPQLDPQLVCGSEMQLLDIHATSHPDLEAYVESRLKNIRLVTKEHRKMIIAKADGHFLYAATVCRMLKGSRRIHDQLKMISAAKAPPEIEEKTDELYTSVLQQIDIEHGEGDEDKPIMDVLSMVIVAFQPLSIGSISTFLSNNDQVDEIVKDLSGVLKTADSTHLVKIIHPTFRDFLLSDQNRAGIHFVDARNSHARMAIACLEALESALKYDVLHVEKADKLSPRNADILNVGALLTQYTTCAVRYASAYWAHHVAAAKVSTTLWKTVLEFLRQKFLNWVELMSWRGCVPTCIEGLSRLYMKARTCHKEDPSTLNSSNLLAIRQAYQFVIYHQTLLVESALQVYSMALAFTPAESPIFDEYRKHYLHHQPTIRTADVIEWGNQMMLKGHSGLIRQILFSPDGAHLASLGDDGTLRLWNAETGELTKAFSGESESDSSMPDIIVHCAFSPNGQLFAFSTTSNQLHIRSCHDWEPVLPSIIREKVSRDPSNVRFAFSPSKPHIAFAEGGSVSLLNWETGKEVKSFKMSVDECKIVDLAISPNGRKMVCIGAHCSDPKKGRVYLWDLDSFYHVTDYDIEGIISSFSGSCISFSADSTRFATRSDIQSVQLRDAESEKDITIATLKGCKYVVFSPNGNYLASYSTDFDVTIFDQHSGKIMSRLSGHTACILNISFSPDGTRLASVSADQTVRVWAVPSWQPLGTIFPGYTGDVQYAILSTDWKRFVCASLPCRHLSLYDLQTGDSGDSILGRKIKPRSYITANSPTGPYVARGDNLLSEGKGGIQLWDLATKKTPMIKGSDLNIIGLVFSPDGKLIAAASADSYVRLWKTSSQTSKGEPIHVPILSEGEVDALFFSPDSNLLGICASGNAQVWDINTGKLIWQHSGAIFAFDPTSKEVVGVDETNVYMSKLDSKPRPLGPRKRSRYIDAAFSLEELLVAVVHESGIEVWLINESWKLQFEIPIPRGSYRRLSFSPDGEYLAYGQLCWKFDVNNEPYLRYSEDAPPESFSNGGPESHSFLTYKDGWIHSAFPPGPLVPIPSQLRDDACWSAYGNSVILWNDFGEPISIDCTPLLQRFKRT